MKNNSLQLEIILPKNDMKSIVCSEIIVTKKIVFKYYIY